MMQTNKTKQSIKPQIYVACLAAYNVGKLHGRYLDATQAIDDIYQEIQQMLSESPISNAEEWAIHDYEGFGPLRLDENEGIESVNEKAEFIEEHGELGAELIAYYGDIESAQEVLENNYHGEHGSELDFAIELFDECYAHSIPDGLKSYIDYEAFKRDIFIGDYISFYVDRKIHVFSCH